jgi:hypothetical protein
MDAVIEARDGEFSRVLAGQLLDQALGGGGHGTGIALETRAAHRQLEFLCAGRRRRPGKGADVENAARLLRRGREILAHDAPGDRLLSPRQPRRQAHHDNRAERLVHGRLRRSRC